MKEVKSASLFVLFLNSEQKDYLTDRPTDRITKGQTGRWRKVGGRVRDRPPDRQVRQIEQKKIQGQVVNNTFSAHLLIHCQPAGSLI